MARRILRWRDAGGLGLEHLAVLDGGEAIEARSVLISPGPASAWTFRIACDGAWHTRSLVVDEVAGPGHLDIEADGVGHWRVNGQVRPELEGALDVDLSASPFTNTLPIRRLGLQAGQAAEILAAYISFPELDVGRDRQRYTCLSCSTYLFESLDEDFSREITVDGDGFVIDYPGLFARARQD